MPDFSQLTIEEVVSFIDRNFSLFANDRDPDFPDDILAGVRQGEIILVRRKEGFALAFQGKRTRVKQYPADLLFLFVSPENLGQGIGQSMVEEVKRSVVPGLPILVQCEGIERRNYFEKQGFVVEDECPETGTYYLRAEPVSSSE